MVAHEEAILRSLNINAQNKYGSARGRDFAHFDTRYGNKYAW
jgi:hypothetical protein